MRLRYQRKHMFVCMRGYGRPYQAGWHRRSYDNMEAPVPAVMDELLRQGLFLLQRYAERRDNR